MSDDEYTSDSVDSDSELQKAFKEGRLKPGLNFERPPRTKPINNVAGMEQKLAEFKQDLNWLERLDITTKPASSLPSNEETVDDDFKREMLFYRQAQAAVLTALPRLHELGVATRRPEDYFAEMAKPDSHMTKIREKLLEKKKTLEMSEKAKKMRELRKYGKKVQQEVLQKRQKEKREMLDAVKKYRKGKTDNLDFLEGKKGVKEKPSKPLVVNKKRDWKNKKFGFGGQKKRSKQNTKESSASMEGFKPNRPPSSKKGKHKQQRPGKARRKNMRNKRK